MKKNFSLAFAIITFVFVFLALYNVYLFGDDYYYITYSKGPMQEFWAHHVEHYTQINGRAIVHFLVSIFLSQNLIWWKLFNALMLASIVYFGSKIASENTLYSGLAFFLGVCLIGISVSRQSIYWLTGSFNYVYPVFLLFVFWYFLLKYRENPKHTWLMCILSFLAAATVEQGGMMAFGLCFLLVIRDFIVNKKVDKKQIAIWVFALFGVATVILSPATFVRFNLENQEELSFFAKSIHLIKYLLNSYFFTKWMLPLNIAFILLGLMKCKNRILKVIIFFSIPVLLYSVYFITASSVFDLVKVLVIAYLLLSYAIISATVILRDLKTNTITFTIAEILLVGSQIMLAVSSVYGDRNLLFGIFMLILMVAYLTQDIHLAEWNAKTCISAATTLLLAFVSLRNQLTIINGYHESHKIEAQNIEKIESNTSRELVLDTPDINYTWSMPYVSDYHKYYYKMYYNLKNVDVTWK
ncbi:MAG: hypothetical protein IJ217_00685 [Clostridia bacterium]|nr:hypothetical protein [Clostridia bacterium]